MKPFVAITQQKVDIKKKKPAEMNWWPAAEKERRLTSKCMQQGITLKHKKAKECSSEHTQILLCCNFLLLLFFKSIRG